MARLVTRSHFLPRPFPIFPYTLHTGKSCIRFLHKQNARQDATVTSQERGPSHQDKLPDSVSRPTRAEPKSSRVAALESAKPFSSFLTDTFNRQHDYLRISITERCNLRCLYCMPEEGVPLSPKSHLLTPQEILYLSSLFVSQGVTKIRLTGGEPTIHPQFLPLLRDIGSLRKDGLKELAITTNGVTLPRKLDSLAESGVTGINLSLDTLDPFQFEIMTRRRGFDQVMKSISQILQMKKIGVPWNLKINAVVIRGLNDGQIMPFVEMTREQNVEVRFIEYMPFDGNKWSSQKMLGYQEMLAIIREQYPTVYKVQDHPNDTSKTFQVPGFAGRIGFITSMTDHFCGTCNRLRITSDGNLKVCLFGNAEVSLRDMLRNSFNHGEPIDEQAWEAMKQLEMDRKERRATDELGAGPEELQLLDIIGAAVKRKKARHAGIGQLEHMKNRPMILIDNLSPFIEQKWSTNVQNSTKRHTTSLTQPRSGLYIPFLELIPSSTSIATTTRIRQFSSSSRSFKKSGEDHLTHLTPSGSAHMVSIPSPQPPSDFAEASPTSAEYKPATNRVAIARAVVRFSNEKPLELVRTASLRKGDVLAVARVAGIMGAKRTSELIPLCHNIPLGGVAVDIQLVDGEKKVLVGDGESTFQEIANQGLVREEVGPCGGVIITARVHTYGQTGVEMEALSAVTVAGLTVYDMCKGVDKGMCIDAARVILKRGGRSGTWFEGANA